MIFASFKTGDVIHDHVVQGFIDREILHLTEESVLTFLRKKIPEKATQNTARKVYSKLQRQIINRKLTHNKLCSVVMTSDHPLSKEELRQFAGFRRKAMTAKELDELLDEIKEFNPAVYAVVLSRITD